MASGCSRVLLGVGLPDDGFGHREAYKRRAMAKGSRCSRKPYVRELQGGRSTSGGALCPGWGPKGCPTRRLNWPRPRGQGPRRLGFDGGQRHDGDPRWSVHGVRVRLWSRLEGKWFARWSPRWASMKTTKVGRVRANWRCAVYRLGSLPCG